MTLKKTHQSELGFIAQELEAAMDGLDWGNLIEEHSRTTETGETEAIKTLDYS